MYSFWFLQIGFKLFLKISSIHPRWYHRDSVYSYRPRPSKRNWIICSSPQQRDNIFMIGLCPNFLFPMDSLQIEDVRSFIVYPQKNLPCWTSLEGNLSNSWCLSLYFWLASWPLLPQSKPWWLCDLGHADLNNMQETHENWRFPWRSPAALHDNAKRPS